MTKYQMYKWISFIGDQRHRFTVMNKNLFIGIYPRHVLHLHMQQASFLRILINVDKDLIAVTCNSGAFLISLSIVSFSQYYHNYEQN